MDRKASGVTLGTPKKALDAFEMNWRAFKMTWEASDINCKAFKMS